MADSPAQTRWYQWSPSQPNVLLETENEGSAHFEAQFPQGGFFSGGRVQIFGKQTQHERYMGYTDSELLEKLMGHLTALSIPYEAKNHSDETTPCLWNRHHCVWMKSKHFETLQNEHDAISVSSVSPITATLNRVTTFTVSGKNLPETLGFQVEDGHDVTQLRGGSSTTVQFKCKPRWSRGSKKGLITNHPHNNSIAIYHFELTVE